MKNKQIQVPQGISGAPQELPEPLGICNFLVAQMKHKQIQMLPRAPQGALGLPWFDFEGTLKTDQNLALPEAPGEASGS